MIMMGFASVFRRVSALNFLLQIMRFLFLLQFRVMFPSLFVLIAGQYLYSTIHPLNGMSFNAIPFFISMIPAVSVDLSICIFLVVIKGKLTDSTDIFIVVYH